MSKCASHLEPTLTCLLPLRCMTGAGAQNSALYGKKPNKKNKIEGARSLEIRYTGKGGIRLWLELQRTIDELHVCQRNQLFACTL